MELVRARFVDNDCQECLAALLEEGKSLGGLPLSGPIVEVPRHWLGKHCDHGRSGLRFEFLAEYDAEVVEEVVPADDELGANDPSIDATKDIGYPAREHGPYGSHPMHDDFDDESSPDGSGTY